MSTTIVRFLSCAALLGLPACGDDGGGSGSEGSSTEGSSTGGGSTGGGSTSTEPGSTSTAGSEGSGIGGSGEGSTSTGADGGSSGGSSTGAVLECDAQADQETCESTMGCMWVGNMPNGACLPDDATICPELDMQQCQLHPLCDWDNQEAACMPVM